MARRFFSFAPLLRMPLTALRSWRRTVILGLIVLTLGGAARAQASNPADGPSAISNVTDFWNLNTVAGVREYPLRAEIIVLFYDPDWRAIWAEWDGMVCYLGAPETPLPLATGHRVLLDGVVRPGKQEIVWERTKIVERETRMPLRPVATDEAPGKLEALGTAVIETQGLVVDQIDAGAGHVQFTLISDVRSIRVFLLLRAGEPVPQLEGTYVRTRGVLSVKHDTTENVGRCELWIPNTEHLEITSRLAEDLRFAIPATRIEKFSEQAPDQLIRIAGTVHGQERGKYILVRDGTGQVTVLTRQTQPINRGERIEAIGYPDANGIHLILQKGVIRLLPSVDDATTQSSPAAPAWLRLADEVRQLSPEDAARNLPARIFGVVTWSDPETRSFFLQDASGSVKVFLPPDSALAVPKLESGVVVTGVSHPGDFVPGLSAQLIATVTSSSPPAAKVISLEQARAGTEYGAWVKMRGYVQSLVREGPYLRLQLSTSRGEFVARLPAVDWDLNLEGTIVDVRAVCDAIVNARRQITGVQLWIPTSDYIEVIEPLPADVFATPRRTIGNLLRFSSSSSATERAQVSGVVVSHQPGQFFYLQDGDDSLLVLSRQADPLLPGDRVDAVGFPGFAGARLTMREAVYRKVGSGPEPEPRAVNSIERPDVELEGKLVHIPGTLLNVLPGTHETRFQVQSGAVIFEAQWGGVFPADIAPPDAGSAVELTGVYRLVSDEYDHPRGFSLALRSLDDLRVVRRPSWWTAARVIRLAAALLCLAVVTVGWSLLLSRKNQLLRQTKEQLRTANEELELRVAERTRDLQSEIDGHQRAQQALDEERRLLRAVIDNLPLGLYMQDLAGRFVLGNGPHARLLGCKSENEFTGRRVEEFLPAETARLWRHGDEAVLRTGEPLLASESELEIAGRRSWFSTTKVALRDREGKIAGLIGISEDVTARKLAEAEREQMNVQLLDTSRKAGMAEVATGVLHNVGNVLNSVNVSTTLVIDRVRASKVSFVPKVSGLLEEHSADLAAFLTSDPKGQKIPSYLASLGQQLLAEQAHVIEELGQLRKNVEHIKEIVSLQQSFAKVSGVAETVSLSELVDDALRMNSGALERHQVQLVRDYQPSISITVERHKVIQILINLIRNAKYACDDSGRSDKRIVLRTMATETGVQVSVIDNGIGIAPENLTRIFAHGFTTRKDGHGFGLHSGALAAKELGGRLTAASPGLGHGAAFVLDIPVAPPPAASDRGAGTSDKNRSRVREVALA